MERDYAPPARVKNAVAVTFRVEGGNAVLVPTPVSSLRTDGLWKTTCFELFVRPEGSDGYYEFNFSPSGAWAAYAFEGYRAGRRDLEIDPPEIRRLDCGIAVTVDLSLIPQGRWRVSLSAVIEEQNGAKSYWALAHPPGKPDFHHVDCFALELPAASGA